MIKVFYGPDKEFKKQLPDKIRPKTLSEILNIIESHSKTFVVETNERKRQKKHKKTINTLIIKSGEYSRLSDAGYNGLIHFLDEFKFNNIYLQNPPIAILNQFKGKYKQIEIKHHHYRVVDEESMKLFYSTYNDIVVGQEQVADRLLPLFYQVSKGYSKNKPLVILFYGPAGVGKTETAKFLANLFNEKLFRKQLSMYQTEEYSNYMFGGNHVRSCLARELLERESNVILLDEFDKMHRIFYSAFYQMFDEGVFEDKCYKVNLKNSIIICTSNFKSEREIINTLGEPIYSRLDCVIKFNHLDDISLKRIMDINFKEIYNELLDEDKNIIEQLDIYNKLKNTKFSKMNVRELRKYLKEYIFTTVSFYKYNNSISNYLPDEFPPMR